MNEDVRQFHQDIINNELDDVDLFKGFLKYYVSKNYTLKDLQDTLQYVYSFDVLDAVKITTRITTLLFF